jgi:hypothetical protein
MQKKPRNMLLYVTAASVAGVACNNSHTTMGDVAPTPDFTVGKIAMVAPDAATPPAPTSADAAAPLDAAAAAPVDAGTDAGATDAGKPRAAANPQHYTVGRIPAPGKVGMDPDRQ